MVHSDGLRLIRLLARCSFTHHLPHKSSSSVNNVIFLGSYRQFNSGVCNTSVVFGNFASKNVNKKNWFQLGVLGANSGEAKSIHGTDMRLIKVNGPSILFSMVPRQWQD